MRILDLFRAGSSTQSIVVWPPWTSNYQIRRPPTLRWQQLPIAARPDCHSIESPRIGKSRLRLSDHTSGWSAGANVRDWSSTDLTAPKLDFRSSPESGLESDISPCPKSANMRLMHRSKQHFYSITSSACASSVGGTVRPSVFAVLRFMTSSNLVACSTGRSLGLAPLRILST